MANDHGRGQGVRRRILDTLWVDRAVTRSGAEGNRVLGCDRGRPHQVLRRARGPHPSYWWPGPVLAVVLVRFGGVANGWLSTRAPRAP